MKLVRSTTTVREGSKEQHADSICRDLQAYNATGDPLTVEEIVTALTISCLSMSKKFCTLGASLLNDEDLSFYVLDSKARELDHNISALHDTHGKGGADVAEVETKNSEMWEVVKAITVSQR
eukprot:3409588-Rhodomonas_salina.1